MNEEVLKSYEELKRNRNIINTIEPDFFFEIVDCLLKENREIKVDQEIKAKIEELDIAISECIYLDEDDEKYKKAVEKDKLCLLNQKRALQELLEGGQS